MKERGMIFNGEMVRAILDGRKTQTRRIMKVQPSEDFTPMNMALETDYKARWYTPGVVDKDGYLQPASKKVFGVSNENEGYSCPFGAVGDRIWVRETWARYNIDQNSHDIAYRATTPADWPEEGRWRPSIHMPRWASRILLEITNVRVERLKSISDGDAIREGCSTADMKSGDCVADVFARLWASIYGSDSWNANPWVWVIEFKRVEGGAA
ncbi:ASCH domain-containing protein [Klebsiella variicola]|uniref:morphogenetic protein n=1 Tax=Klebsiella variicola TaxID=244366 RepID=UPI0025A5C2FA|nr:morphogenetic protein [Klebsiella variicola]WJP92838.1 morphogenetic protein [Klebsiella variicola]